MARTDVIATAESVATAADEILQSGRNPTVEGVRLHLGGGSPNTVVKYLNAWRTSIGARVLEAQATPPLPAPISGMAFGMWQAALAAAAEHETLQHQEQRVAIALQAAELADERRQVRDQVQAMELEVSAARGRQEEATRQATTATAACEAQRVARHEAEQSLAGALAELRVARIALARALGDRDADRERFDLEQARLLREVDAERQRSRQAEAGRSQADKALGAIQRQHAAKLEATEKRLLAHAEARAVLQGKIKQLEKQIRTVRAKPPAAIKRRPK